MRRVALFSTNFLPYSQIFVHEELRHLERYEADVFAWRRFHADRFPHPRVHLAALPYIATRRSARFDAAFHERRFDVVHAHFGPGGCYAMPFAERHDVPLVVTFHGYDVPLLTSPRRFLPLHLPYARRAPSMLRGMALGLCASEELRDMLIDYGVPADKLVHYHLGIDLARFVPGTRDPARVEVIMIGRFVEKKGFEYGLRAFAEATRDAATPTRLTLVGDGEREQALRALVDELGIADRVRFAGVITQPEVATLLSRADVLLAPSVVAADGNRDSGLIVVKEASASHVVPIGTLHGGIPEIIDDEKTGYLVAERDVTTMARRLRTLVDDPALRERLGSAAREKMVQEYDIRARVAELERLYDRASA